MILCILCTRAHVYESTWSYDSFPSLMLRASIFVVHLQPIKTLLDLTPLSRRLAAITPGFTGMFGAHIRIHCSRYTNGILLQPKLHPKEKAVWLARLLMDVKTREFQL